MHGSESVQCVASVVAGNGRSRSCMELSVSHASIWERVIQAVYLIGAVPSSAVPDSAVSDSSVPDSGSKVPDSAVSDASVPDSGYKDGSAVPSKHTVEQ